MLYVTQLLILLFGFMFGFFMYEFTRYRAGGVVAIPLLVLYALEAPMTLPIFIYSIAMCLFLGYIVTEKVLLYGRRILYLYLAISIVITSISFFFILYYLNIDILTISVAAIFPGLIAYNISREAYNFRSGLNTILMMTWHFLIVAMFGIVMMLLSGWRP